MSIEIEKLVEDCCSKLLEHCDSVRIFVTAHNGGGEETAGYTSGAGNFYAQRGQVQEWLVKQDELERQDARKGDV